MNVGYKELNCADVGKGLHLDKTTVAAWCRKGYINYTDVSEPGSKKARYQIPEWEYERLKKLIGKFGRRNWLLHNTKDKERAYQEHVCLPAEEQADIEARKILNELADVPVKLPKQEEPQYEPKIMDDDKLLNAIIYIREVKERIEDCKAELAQLENEYRELKEEIVNQL